MREVEIIIRGKRASGKTTALALVTKALRSLGFEVAYDEPTPSMRRAFNHTVENIDPRSAQPMKVHLREELSED